MHPDCVVYPFPVTLLKRLSLQHEPECHGHLLVKKLLVLKSQKAFKFMSLILEFF